MQNPPPIDVGPSEKNPYNDPDFNPNFFVTEGLTGHSQNEPGGLLGLLLAAARQGQLQRDVESMSVPDGAQMYTALNGERGNPQAVNVVDAAAPDIRSRMSSRAVSSAVAGRNSAHMTSPRQNGALLGLVSGQPMPQWPFPPPIFDPRR